MKVLFAVPYIYDVRYPEFSKNNTGFGIMVNEIYKSLSNCNEVYLFTHAFTKGHGNIVKHTVLDFIKNVKFRDIIQAINWFFKYKQSIKGRCRYAFYCLNKGILRKYILELCPEIVHIHGIGMQTKVFIEVCEELKTPYTVTLHGLIGLNETVVAADWDKQYERDFLIESEKRGIPVSVISTGIKKRIEDYYLDKKSTSITVIGNGIIIPKYNTNNGVKLREQYNIPKNAKIAVSVGTICERKNQLQTVRAFSIMPEEIKAKIYLFLCGTDKTNGHISKEISKYGLQSHVFLLGFVQHEDIGNIYDQVDVNIVASVDEGFGLSIIEAYSHGVPTVAFSDLDAIVDLFNEETMIECKDRTDASFANSIIESIERKWNREYIAEYSQKFSMEKIARQYELEYKRIISISFRSLGT